jgi:hypothetical protein
LLHRSSPPLALSTPCPCTHYTHGLSTTSPSFTFTPVFHTARHVHWYGPSRHQLASLTHTTLLVPHGLTPQPSSPQTTAAADTTRTSQALTTHQLVPHKPPLPTICSSQTSTATNWRNKACSSQAHPYNCLLLTDLYNNKLAQQGLLLTSAPVQLSAPHRQFVQQGLLLTSARTYTHRHNTTPTSPAQPPLSPTRHLNSHSPLPARLLQTPRNRSLN